jgi:transposase InsO family protein
MPDNQSITATYEGSSYRSIRNPDVIHIDQGTAFHNKLVQELLRLCGIEHSFATMYSSEENGIVERANQEVFRHLHALLFDSRVHDKWSFERLSLVQRFMNTVEKTSTGVTPAESFHPTDISYTATCQ